MFDFASIAGMIPKMEIFAADVVKKVAEVNERLARIEKALKIEEKPEDK